MEKLTLDELIDQFKGMTLTELQAFVQRFEETFGVSAALVIPSNAMRGRVDVHDMDLEPEPEEQYEFDVKLVDVGPKKINVIKEVRQLRSLGLKEAKDLVDSAPVFIMVGCSKVEAENIVRLLVAVGATAEIK
jgi:large subunit ribosomal protein L7/L12